MASREAGSARSGGVGSGGRVSTVRAWRPVSRARHSCAPPSQPAVDERADERPRARRGGADVRPTRPAVRLPCAAPPSAQRRSLPNSSRIRVARGASTDDFGLQRHLHAEASPVLDDARDGAYANSNSFYNASGDSEEHSDDSHPRSDGPPRRQAKIIAIKARRNAPRAGSRA